jgi:hypothetical protein
MLMTNKFCLYLNHAARFEYDAISPCCWITKKGNLNDTKQLAEYRTWLSEIDDWVPECNYCHDKETRGIDSPRQRVKAYPYDSLGILPDTEPNDITSLELQIDSSCNAACLICGDYNSSTWEKYNIGKITDKSNSNKLIDLNNVLRTNSRFEILKKTIQLDKINTLVFLGGEPLNSDLHKEMLYEIEKVKPLNDVRIRYVTNGSKIPDDETIIMWRQVKDLRIVFSLDGIGEHFNYLRWPLQWNQVEKNIKFFIDLNIPTMSIGISSAINPFNIFYYDRYLAWEKEFFKVIGISQRGVRFSKAFESTGIINTQCIPPKLSTQIYKKYFISEPWLIKHMNSFNAKLYDEFVQYIKLHDEKRGLNWKEVFPEIVEYFPNFGAT